MKASSSPGTSRRPSHAWRLPKARSSSLHDTTEFSFQRERPEAIGKTRVLPSARIGQQPITKCGLLMHSSLAITTAGKPLGLTAVKFWTRKKFKGTNALEGPWQGWRQALGERHADSDRAEREHSLAGESAAVDATRESRSLHSHRRPRERHLRTVLPSRRAKTRIFSCGRASIDWLARETPPSPER